MLKKRIGSFVIEIVGFICLKCGAEKEEEKMYSRCYACGQGICFDCAKELNLKGAERRRTWILNMNLVL